MTVSIVKTKFAADLRYFTLPDSGGESDDDGEEAEEDIRVMTRQRNHSTRTVNRAYANTTSGSFGNVWDGLIRQNLQASFLWQGLWGVTALLTLARKRKASIHDIADAKETGGAVIQRPQLLQRVTKGTYRRRPQWTATEIRQGA
jgi:hypothetical protein